MQTHEPMMVVDGQEQPISRTYQYRKVGIVLLKNKNNSIKKKKKSRKEKN